MRGPTQGTALKVYESLAWLDEIKRVAAMLVAMDIDPSGIEYRGDRANGIVIDHRAAEEWLVSFRPTGPDRARTRYYPNPVDAAEAVVTGEDNARGRRP